MSRLGAIKARIGLAKRALDRNDILYARELLQEAEEIGYQEGPAWEEFSEREENEE